MKLLTWLRLLYVLVVLTVSTVYVCLFMIVGAVFAAGLAIVATGDPHNASMWVIAVITFVGTWLASWRTAPWLDRQYELAREWIKQVDGR